MNKNTSYFGFIILFGIGWYFLGRTFGFFVGLLLTLAILAGLLYLSEKVGGR